MLLLLLPGTTINYYSETCLEKLVPRYFLMGRHTYYWQKVPHFNTFKPISKEHGYWETTFLWPMELLLKRCSTVPLLLHVLLLLPLTTRPCRGLWRCCSLGGGSGCRHWCEPTGSPHWGYDSSVQPFENLLNCALSHHLGYVISDLTLELRREKGKRYRTFEQNTHRSTSTCSILHVPYEMPGSIPEQEALASIQWYRVI